VTFAAVRAWERGRGRWPALDLAWGPFTALDVDWERVQAEDLYLARACIEHSPGAATAFRAAYREDLIAFALTVVKAPAAATELADDLLADLLVGPDGTPRLATYSGRGPLRAWLRMTTVRRALNLSRDRARRAELDARLLHEAVSAARDPELALLKDRYGAAFETAFRDALATLPSAERTLLALHHGQGVALDAIGKMHRWSRPTASRRVAAAREALLDAACRLVRERLALDAGELESVLRLVRSQLEITLSGLLKRR
jgi:RNA polymerase sigma-70 factor (ECF subfamily)